MNFIQVQKNKKTITIGMYYYSNKFTGKINPFSKILINEATDSDIFYIVFVNNQLIHPDLPLFVKSYK